MRVARLYKADDIRIEDDPMPAAGPGEAVVRTRACGICTGDIMGWYMERKAPLVLIALGIKYETQNTKYIKVEFEH